MTTMLTSPIVLAVSAEKLIAAVRTENRRPVQFEVMFGPESIEALDRQVLRTITGISEMFGVPVTFPEEPGPQDRCIWLRLRTEDGAASLFIAAEVLNSSR